MERPTLYTHTHMVHRRSTAPMSILHTHARTHRHTHTHEARRRAAHIGYEVKWWMQFVRVPTRGVVCARLSEHIQQTWCAPAHRHTCAHTPPVCVCACVDKKSCAGVLGWAGPFKMCSSDSERTRTNGYFACASAVFFVVGCVVVVIWPTNEMTVAMAMWFASTRTES